MAPRKRPAANAGSDSGSDEGSAAAKQRAMDPASPDTAGDCSRVEGAYLDTINRASLDFDFEQLCSVSLSNNNVYACLVCGKYYQGRGKQTHAYFHSINDAHHVFVNLRSLRVYVLPDGYEVADQSLNDIKDAIQPPYSPQLVAQLDARAALSRDLSGKPYLPGFVGLNRIKHNSYMNAVVQALAHVPPIRDALLLLPDLDRRPALLQRMALLVRKMWHSGLFKAHVSPHEFAQEAVDRSKRRFRLDAESDAFEFLTWLLNTLHIDLGGTRKKGSSVVYTTFQGQIRTTTQAVDSAKGHAPGGLPLQLDASRAAAVDTMPFMALSLELPPKPLFVSTSAPNDDDSDDGGNDDGIPQVALVTLLQRYNGSTVVEWNGQARQYQPLHLPRYIICHIKRFSRTGLLAEKNPAVVSFPIRNVRFGDLLPSDAPQRHTADASFDLIANICHIGQQPPGTAAAGADGKQPDAGLAPPPAQPDEHGASTAKNAAEGQFMTYTRCSANGKWYMLRDLQVEPILPQMLFLSDSYIQIWQRDGV